MFRFFVIGHAGTLNYRYRHWPGQSEDCYPCPWVLHFRAWAPSLIKQQCPDQWQRFRCSYLTHCTTTPTQTTTVPTPTNTTAVNSTGTTEKEARVNETEATTAEQTTMIETTVTHDDVNETASSRSVTTEQNTVDDDGFLYRHDVNRTLGSSS